MALTGNELVQVIGITETDGPSGRTFQCTTQDIADLDAGTSILDGNELLYVRGESKPDVPSGQVFQCTTQDIADIVNGSGPLDGTETLEVIGVSATGAPGARPFSVTTQEIADLSPADPIPLFIFGLESNSGGYALNSDPTPEELEPREMLTILNNANFELQAMEIGVNNLIDHAGLVNNATHGLENGLANTLAIGRFNVPEAYLVKCGQGGSTIAQWSVGNPTGYWATLVERVEDIRAQLDLLGINYQPIMFYSQGINDIIASTNPVTWKAATIEMLGRIRTLFEDPEMPIYITNFTDPPLQAMDESYNDEIDEICAEVDFTYLLDTSDTTARDINHWDYEGFIKIAERFVDGIVGVDGTLASPVITPEGDTFEEAQEITITGPADAMILYSTNLEEPSSHSTLYTGPFEVGSSTSVKAIAIKKNWKNSPMAQEDYVINIPGEFVSWTEHVNAVSDGDFLDCTSSGFTNWAGARADLSINATQPFAVEWDITNDVQSEAVVVYLDDVSADDFQWGSGKVFITGAYWFSGTMYFADGGFNALDPQAQGAPFRFKMEKSGNNVVFSKSTNGGMSWTPVHTYTNGLLGKTTIYLKALFAVQAVTKTVAAELIGQ